MNCLLLLSALVVAMGPAAGRLNGTAGLLAKRSGGDASVNATSAPVLGPAAAATAPGRLNGTAGLRAKRSGSDASVNATSAPALGPAAATAAPGRLNGSAGLSAKRSGSDASVNATSAPELLPELSYSGRSGSANSNSSCAKRCGKYRRHADCQCNPSCAKWADCCPDYTDRCPNLLKLYHQTNYELGQMILSSGFLPGRGGWCGGAIYFATTAKATDSKAIGRHSHTGYIISAVVDLGKTKKMDRHCNQRMTGKKLHSQGYDSITFNPGDGDEYVIYSPDRVLSTKGYTWSS